jgi:hypothetical protein
MGVGYLPYRPLFELKAVVPNIWIADGGEVRMRLGFLRLPFPTRMTVVRLPDAGLWLHSPIALEERLVEQIRSAGPVTDIIAPNTLHSTWAAAWSRRFPDARVWASPGFSEQARATLPRHRVLTDEAPGEWQETFRQVIVFGGPVTEVDFFHNESRTLILTDAIENLDLRRFRSAFYRLLTWAAGSADPHGRLPFELRQHFKLNRAHNRAAVDRMIGWAPLRILLAHGRCYDRDAVRELERAFSWL